MLSCAKCGGRTVRKAARETRTIAGRAFDVRLAARTCAQCGAMEPEPESLRRADLDIACHLAVDGPVDGASLRHIRRALDMRASELADLLEITAETVSRWENNQRRIDRGAWLVVGSLLLEAVDEPPRTLARLRALSSGIVPGEAVIDARRPSGRAKRISGVVARGGVRQRAT